MKRFLLVMAVAALYVLHQDIWFWHTPHPLLFGFIPIGLLYHALFSVAAALLMGLLVAYAWPSHLEREVESSRPRTETSPGAATPTDTPR